MFGMSLTWTRSPTLKRPEAFVVLSCSFSFIARFHLRNLLQQFGQRNMFLVDEHARRGPDPAAVIGHAEIERITQIVICAAAPFLGRPYTLPAEHFARHIC